MRINDVPPRPVDAIFPARREAVARGICPTCNGEVGEFRDDLSVTEFRISGMCQACQDAVFGGPDHVHDENC